MGWFGPSDCYFTSIILENLYKKIIDKVDKRDSKYHILCFFLILLTPLSFQNICTWFLHDINGKWILLLFLAYIALQKPNESSSKKSSHTSNIIDNHNFSNGLHSWNANCCDAFLASPVLEEKNTTKSCKQHAVVTNRTQNWQGLEQDITSKISSGSTYTVFARVGVSGTRLSGKADVIASLRLEYKHSSTKYLNITRYIIHLFGNYFPFLCGGRKLSTGQNDNYGVQVEGQYMLEWA